MIVVDNKKDLEVLHEFQSRIPDQDEVTCIRFLIARDFNLELAEEMFQSNLKWRKEIGIEEIFNWNPIPEYVVNDLPFKFTGTNHFGGPVIWLPLGIWKARYWIERGMKDEVIKWAYYILENVLRRLTEVGNKRATVIFGMEELTYWKVSHMDTLKVLYTGFQALEQNYPEILDHLIVINAPWVFQIAFNFIKPILSQRTLDKIQVHGSDKKKYLPKLKEICDDEAIPSQYLD